MVGQDHQHGVPVDLLHDPAHEGIHLNVQVAQHIRVALIGHRRAPAFVLVKAKEHVLDPVGEVEHAHHRAAPGFAQGVEEHRLALLMNVLRLLEESVLADHPLIQPRGVLGNSERREGALPFGQIN